MSSRDELRGTLCNTVCNASNYTKRAQPYLLGSDMSVVLDKTADALLAAGYRKPRTITTAEELDVVPVGSVVALWIGSEIVNVALKTSADEWGLAGQSRPLNTATFARAAIVRDGYAVTVLIEGKP